MRLYSPALNLRSLGFRDDNAIRAAADKRGVTPLMRAAQCGHLPLTRLLLAQGENVNASDKHGGTPLMVACKEGHAAIACLLLARGADVNARTKDSRFTPLSFAVHHVRMARRDEALLQSNGSARLIKYLLRHGSNVEARDRQGNSILQYAATHNRIDAARLLLAHKADVNAQSRQGYTPLIIAVGYGSEPMTRLLLSAGADVTLCTRRGHDALWFAQKRNRTRIAKLLAQAGATGLK